MESTATGVNFCPSCGQGVQAGVRFCTQCGVPLASATPVPFPMQYNAAAMPPPPTQYAMAVAPRTNGFAVASLVLGIIPIGAIGCLLAVLFGSIARRQIRESNGRQTGDGMAKAGIILGFAWIALFVLVVIVVVVGSACRGSGQ